jgi:hypothetical protein
MTCAVTSKQLRTNCAIKSAQLLGLSLRKKVTAQLRRFTISTGATTAHQLRKTPIRKVGEAVEVFPTPGCRR